VGPLRERILKYIEGDEAVPLLAKYYGGRYTGAHFDTCAELQSPEPNRFTAHDIAAVATLSVPLTGRAVVGLLEMESELVGLLDAVPFDVDLADAGQEVLEAVFRLQEQLDGLVDIGHVTRSKLLARKRPRLVPIRDQHVLTALLDRADGPFTEPLRDVLAADSQVAERLNEVQRQANLPVPLSTLRALDVIVWMAVHGDSQVSS
jgi:hypothetical protein